FFSSRRRHTRLQGDWSSDVCSSDLDAHLFERHLVESPGNLETFCLLVFLQSRPSASVKLSGLLSRIETFLFQNRLCLFDLNRGRAKNWTSLDGLVRVARSTV